MNVKQIIISVFLVTFCTFHLLAGQKMIENNVIDKHYGWISIAGGYYSLLEKFDDLKTLGGGNLNISGGYEFRYSGFYTSIGFEMSFWQSNAYTLDYAFEQMMHDTQGKCMNYHFDISASKESSYGMYGYIPIMIGYTNSGFYIGCGAKIGYNLFAKNHTSRDYTTSATYPQYFQDFEDMPNHYYTHYRATNTENLNLNVPLSLIAEVGYDVLYGYSYGSYTRDKVLKIGVYAEYGLLNSIKNATDESLFKSNSEHPIQLDVFSYYNHKATISVHLKLRKSSLKY